MIATSQSMQAEHRIRLRPIALPIEHGGWSLVLEPIVLGLLLAPSATGLLISLGALALFLARHPYKIAVKDCQAHRRGRRTALAGWFAILYFSAGAAALIMAITVGGPAFLFPLAVAAPIAVIQLVLDATGRSRSLVAELAGSIATGSLATAIAMSGGWPRSIAFALWAVIVARSAPTILYLRARLRLARGKPANSMVPILIHAAALLLVVLLARMELLPWLSVLPIVVLLFRAVTGLSKSATRVTPQVLGVRELSFGLLTVLSVAIGAYLHL